MKRKAVVALIASLLLTAGTYFYNPVSQVSQKPLPANTIGGSAEYDWRQVSRGFPLVYSEDRIALYHGNDSRGPDNESELNTVAIFANISFWFLAVFAFQLLLGWLTAFIAKKILGLIVVVVVILYSLLLISG